MIYDYEVTTGKGETLKLSDYKGKVILVVNTATVESLGTGVIGDGSF